MINLDQEQQKVKKSEILNAFYEGRELILNVFKSRIFPIKSTQGKGHPSSFDLPRLKLLTPKQKLQRITIALAQVKVGNKSENLLNEIGQLIYSLYQTKEITKKPYNNIMNSINALYKNEYYNYEF